MGGRSTLRGNIAVGLLVLLASIVVGVCADAGEVEARAVEASRCDRPSSSSLLETRQVRIYATPPESTADPKHQDPAIAGPPVFACLKTTGKSRLLDFPPLGGTTPPIWVAVDQHVFAARGALVAYAYTQDYFDSHETWVRVRDLRTGRVTRSCLVGGALAPSSLPHVTYITLSSDGTVKWRAREKESNPSEHASPGCDPTG